MLILSHFLINVASLNYEPCWFSFFSICLGQMFKIVLLFILNFLPPILCSFNNLNYWCLILMHRPYSVTLNFKYFSVQVIRDAKVCSCNSHSVCYSLINSKSLQIMVWILFTRLKRSECCSRYCLYLFVSIGLTIEFHAFQQLGLFFRSQIHQF